MINVSGERISWSGINEELHLGLFQVCLAAALVCIDDIQDDACCDQDIEEICLG